MLVSKRYLENCAAGFASYESPAKVTVIRPKSGPVGSEKDETPSPESHIKQVLNQDRDDQHSGL